MNGDNKKLYEAFVSKDARFDGRFFVGILSTKIYCRPICKAKKALFKNCDFFATATSAEMAGYRPCLLCRPEIVTGTIGPAPSLARKLALIIDENLGQDVNLSTVAEQLGCTDRHLRRIFSDEYKVPPIQYLQTSRLLLAKNLLTDTTLPILSIAMTAGFGSLRRFNDAFKTHYHLTPSNLRDEFVNKSTIDGTVSLQMSYRPPYRWNELIAFLAGRAITGVEIIKDNSYFRTVVIETNEHNFIYGWLKVSNDSDSNSLVITIKDALLPVLPLVLAKTRHLFDLYCDPTIIYQTLEIMNQIKPGACLIGTRLPGSFDPFEMSVRAILGQQITVKAASTLASRIVNTYGQKIETGVDGLTHIFPTPHDIVALDGSIDSHLGPLGIIKTRANTIKDLACALIEKRLTLNLSSDPQKTIEQLMDIRGIGHWTAQYIAMRTIGWTDAFLETDIGIKNALTGYTPKELIALSKAWQPWRSYATINLWHSLDKERKDT